MVQLKQQRSINLLTANTRENHVTKMVTPGGLTYTFLAHRFYKYFYVNKAGALWMSDELLERESIKYIGTIN